MKFAKLLRKHYYMARMKKILRVFAKLFLFELTCTIDFSLRSRRFEFQKHTR